MSSAIVHPLLAVSLTSLVARIADVAEPWKQVYGDSTLVSTSVLFVHIASLVVGGGLAIAADRGTLRAAARASRSSTRRRQLGEIAATHRPVLIALTLTMVSGGLLFLSDVETYASSRAFWIKIVLVALLLANGLVMSRAESSLRAPLLGTDPSASLDSRWRRLRHSAIASVVLWLGTVLAGTVLGSV